MQQSVDVVLMVLRRPLTVHFLVVVKKVRVYFVQEPLLLCYCLLNENKQTGAYPVNKSSCWPLVGEGQVEELQNLKERSKPIHEPVFVFLCDSSL